MGKNKEIWLKAAVLGSIWGASEIVLGTFLHSLRIPFSSNLLTAIGIILMIAGHRLWPEKGLIWRAGLICAALKTLSPSHAIFGPMLAISMQAVLMQFAVSLGGRSSFSYLLGGGLAMSWNLLQRILNALVVYGATMIDLYQSLVGLLERNTGLVFTEYWTPLLVLAAIFFSGGMIAATAGLYISKNVKSQDNSFWRFPVEPSKVSGDEKPHERKIAAILKPLAILAGIVVVLLLIFKLPVQWSAILVFALLGTMAVFDRSIFGGVFKKPGFWIGLLVMVSLSGFLLGRNAEGFFTVEGLKIGIEMMLRALVVITGFKLLGGALRGPAIAAWFQVKQFEGFLMATRIAFQTTPLLLESIPAQNAWKNPLMVLRQIVSGMDHALHYMKSINGYQNIIIITGQKSTGKTRTVLKLSEMLKSQGYTVEGFAAPKVFDNNIHAGYNIRNLSSLLEVPFATRKEPFESANASIPYEIQAAGLEAGSQWLSTAEAQHADLAVMDEIGPLELKGGGWAEALNKLLTSRHQSILLVIRPALVDSCVNKWNLSQPRVLDVEKHSQEEIIEKISSTLVKTPESYQTKGG